MQDPAGELALHPLVSDRRMAVIWCAEKLSLEASNSLLKLTERASRTWLYPLCIRRGQTYSYDKKPCMVSTHRFAGEIARQDLIRFLTRNGRVDSRRQKKDPEILYLEIGSWIKDLFGKRKIQRGGRP